MQFLDPRKNRDHMQRISRRITGKVLIALLLAAGLLTVYGLWGWNYFYDRLGVINAVVGASICFILPALLLGLPRTLMDRSFEGTVVSVKRRTAIRPRATRGGPATEERICVLIELPDGDVKLLDERLSPRLAYFQKGDRLRHIRDTKYFQRFREGRSQIDCVLCGYDTEETETVCCRCGYSLVK